MAQRSHLNRASNLRASWLKKFSLWVSYDSTTIRAVLHVSFLCKTCVLLRGTSFGTHWLPLFKLLDSYQTLAWLSATWRDKKRSMWLCTIVKTIVKCKFRFLHVSGYQLDKNWCAVLSSGLACRDWWLKSVFLFIHRSDSFSVALLGSS